ncbi:MAG: GNAT family N-acetyltransferase [Thermoplasmata archaeon]|nr:GNAT family N-acetyltransferase [Thermoplasmata archaeon]
MSAGTGSTVLEGPRVLLRPPRPDDTKQTFAWYNDPEIVAPYDRFSVDSFEEFERSIRDAPDDPTSLAPRFVVCLREGDTPIGFVGHYVPHPVLETIDVWYVIGAPSARQKGYATESVGLLVAHLFDTSPLPRVGATCDVENQPSVRLLERLGFRREGVLRSALFHHARWHDIAVYGIIRSEWAASRPPT